MANLFIDLAKSRKHFHRNFFRIELILLVLMNMLACVWIGLITFVATEHLKTIPSFYACSSDGILSPLKAMPQPNRSSTAMLE